MKINKFLLKINPGNLVLTSFSIWFFVYLTSPLKININLNLYSYLYIIICLFFFFLGSIKFRGSDRKLPVNLSNENIVKLFNLICFFAIIGLFFKFYDRFLIRGISLLNDVFLNRDIMIDKGGGLTAIIAALLSPFGYFTLFIAWKYKALLPNYRIKLYISILLFFLPTLIDAVTLGTRSIIFVTILLFIFYVSYFGKFRYSISKLFYAILFIIVFLFMNYIFVERTKLFAGDYIYELVLIKSNINYTITSTDNFYSNFLYQSPFWQSILFTYVTTVQYFTHGLVEFSYLFDNFNSEHLYGQYTFSVIHRFLSMVFNYNYDINNIYNVIPRGGVFTTFFGPVFIDFGYLGSFIFMYFFGKFTYFCYRKAIQDYDVAILMYFYICIVLLFIPVFNFISGANGIFIFLAISLLHLLTGRYNYK